MLKMCFYRIITIVSLLQLGSAPALAQITSEDLHWISAWYSPIDTAGPEIPPSTIRQNIRPSIGGKQARVHFSNRFGEKPLVLTSVTISKLSTTGTSEMHPRHPLSFNGLATVIIYPGEEITSDPTPISVNALQPLEISFYTPTGALKTSLHGASMQTALLAHHKNLVYENDWNPEVQDDSRYFVSGLDILTAKQSKLIAIIGDSITDGVGIANDTYHRWPDVLAERLQSTPTLQHLSVLNAGIAGNRVMRDAQSPFVGTATISRFETDVLKHEPLACVIFLQGTNDILANTLLPEREQQVSIEELMNGIKRLIHKTHGQGHKIYGGTLLPRAGSTGILTHTDAAEKMRQEFNHWVRTSNAFDAVIDFDAALRDPNQPQRLAPHFDSGDHTHPNAAGYHAMAMAIDLSLFEDLH